MEQAVLVCFPLSGSSFGDAWEIEILDGLTDDLAEVVAESGVGEFDGHDVGEGQYTLYLYAPDADELFERIEPLLVRQTWPGEVIVRKRYGPPGAPEVRVAVRKAE